MEFRLPERGCFIFAVRKVCVEVLHQRARSGIVHIPQCPDDALGASEQERFRESINPFLAFELSGRRIASLERHQVR